VLVGTYGARPRERAASGAANRRARAVPVDRVSDAQRLDRELWPDRQQVGTGPIERRLRELGGVKALVVAAGRLCGAQRRRPHARRRPCRSGHSAYEPSLPGRSIEGEAGSKTTAVRGFRRCSLERTVSTLSYNRASPSQALQRPSLRPVRALPESRTSLGWRFTSRQPLKTPAPTAPKCPAASIKGVSRRCGACEGVGAAVGRATSVPRPGAHSSCRATTQAEPGVRPGRGAAVLCCARGGGRR
jgi:hypothetical protein